MPTLYCLYHIYDTLYCLDTVSELRTKGANWTQMTLNHQFKYKRAHADMELKREIEKGKNFSENSLKMRKYSQLYKNLEKLIKGDNNGSQFKLSNTSQNTYTCVKEDCSCYLQVKKLNQLKMIRNTLHM